MMGNYEYIVSSLPALSPDWRYGADGSFASYVGWIKTQLGESDKKAVDTLLDGFRGENLDRGFYETVLAGNVRFLREYFTFDLNVRNAKARYVNGRLGRERDTDTIPIETGEFAEASRLEEVLETGDLLARERALDSLTWDKIVELNRFDYFNLDAILGFIARLHVIDRWFSLDEETGREMFNTLIDEVRSTFKGVNEKY